MVSHGTNIITSEYELVMHRYQSRKVDILCNFILVVRQTMKIDDFDEKIFQTFQVIEMLNLHITLASLHTKCKYTKYQCSNHILHYVLGLKLIKISPKSTFGEFFSIEIVNFHSLPT